MVRTSTYRPENARADSSTEVSFVEAIENNLSAYWLALGMNAKGIVHESDSLCWEYSGGPYLNRVVGTHLSQETADAHIRSVKRTFRNRKAAVTWLIGPSASPGDLGSRLIRHGFVRCEPWQGMARDLSRLHVLPPAPGSVEISKVDDEDSQQAWVDVISRSYELPKEAKQLLLESFALENRQDEVTWIHYLGRSNGVPVAASTLFVSEEVAGIYLVATVPEARNEGYGTALTAHVLQRAREEGCKLAVLQSAGSAHRIYERLGFRHYCEIEVYRLPAPRPLWKRIASRMVRFPLRRRRLTSSNGNGVRRDRRTSRGSPVEPQAVTCTRH